MKKPPFSAVTALFLLVGTAVATAGDAATYPSRPVEITVQWAEGGGADLVFRVLAEVFPKYANGQPLVIKNVAGNSGVTGTVEFLSATADGYQILHWANAHVSKTHMSNVPYAADSFEPVAQVVEIPFYILVQDDAPWRTLGEFLDDVRSRPGDISLANAGAGGGGHLAALMFEEATGAEFLHIPFSGGGLMIPGLLSDQVDAAMGTSPEGLAEVESGALRMLVNFGTKRFAAFPDVPTAAELGLDLVMEQWRGVAVPKGTPPEIRDRLHDILRQAVRDPIYVEKIQALGAVPAYRSTDDFRKFIVDEDKRFEDLIRAKGFGDRYGK